MATWALKIRTRMCRGRGEHLDGNIWAIGAGSMAVRDHFIVCRLRPAATGFHINFLLHLPCFANERRADMWEAGDAEVERRGKMMLRRSFVRFGLRFEVVADGKESFWVGVAVAIVGVVL